MKKQKTAAALHYSDKYKKIPHVSAIGKGITAENIIQKAAEHHIPIVQDHSLVELLAALEVNDLIPPTLFDPVAEVFAFIYEIDRSVSAYNEDIDKQSKNNA